MVKKGFWGVILAVGLVFGLVLAGCASSKAAPTASRASKPVKPYTAGEVYLSPGGVWHYYFSSTPEGIDQAVADNGLGDLKQSIGDDTVKWTLNSGLSLNVKNEMVKRDVSYSAGVFNSEGKNYLVVNKYDKGSWYYVSLWL